MSTPRLREVLIGFGKGKQTDIATANLVANVWQLKKLNAQLANPKLNVENDAEEYGKGHEFPTTTFKTAYDVGGTIEKYLSAEIAAWAMCFGLGKVVKSGTNPNFTYTCTPLIPANGDAAELPYFSFIEQIRPGAGVVIDRMAGGCARAGRTEHERLRAWPRQQQDQRPVRRIRQDDGAFRHHDARRDCGKAAAVGL